MTMLFVHRLLISCGLLILLVGCSGEVPANLGKRSNLKGVVNLKGKPVTKAYVVFTPTEKGKGEEQNRELSKNGEYMIGLFPGKYKVSIQGNKSIPVNLQSSKTTPKEIDVPVEDKEGFNIDF